MRLSGILEAPGSLTAIVVVRGELAADSGGTLGCLLRDLASRVAP